MRRTDFNKSGFMNTMDINFDNAYGDGPMGGDLSSAQMFNLAAADYSPNHLVSPEELLLGSFASVDTSPASGSFDNFDTPELVIDHTPPTPYETPSFLGVDVDTYPGQMPLFTNSIIDQPGHVQHSSIGDLASLDQSWLSVQANSCLATATDRDAAAPGILGNLDIPASLPPSALHRRKPSASAESSASRAKQPAPKIAKPRTRKASLKDIKITEEMTAKDAKRARNTLAARGSRERKARHLDAVERLLQKSNFKVDKYAEREDRFREELKRRGYTGDLLEPLENEDDESDEES
jgi:hypothetical protein